MKIDESLRTSQIIADFSKYGIEKLYRILRQLFKKIINETEVSSITKSYERNIVIIIETFVPRKVEYQDRKLYKNTRREIRKG